MPSMKQQLLVPQAYALRGLLAPNSNLMYNIGAAAIPQAISKVPTQSVKMVRTGPLSYIYRRPWSTTMSLLAGSRHSRSLEGAERSRLQEVLNGAVGLREQSVKEFEKAWDAV